MSPDLQMDVLLALAVTAIALVSAAAGVWLAAGPRAGRFLVPFAAGLLMGMALFGVWPEMAESAGPAGGAAILALGFGLLWFVDRFVHPVCPSCSHTHNHGSCAVTLHGFALPLVIAAVLHSFMDGLAVAASRQEGPAGLGWGVFLAVAIHKIPEGLAYGTILRAAVNSRWAALGWCAVAQAPTVVGGALESLVAANLGSVWVVAPLALAGGSFLYLGLHAVHNDYKQRGALAALAPAIIGLAGSACTVWWRALN
ncbi:MAG TPA: ZIP family metal transporter [Bryobacteraceae bacterium]|nr:ZIP family metal transporter [Bryobacteraceae bacterium]